MYNTQHSLLSETSISKGAILTIYWGAGSKQVTTWNEDGTKTVQMVPKTSQQIIHISPSTIKFYDETPTEGFSQKSWEKRTKVANVLSHVKNWIHDMKMNGNLVDWKLEAVKG